MRQAQADTPLRRMPLVVLSHSKTLPNPFGFPPDWPVEALERAFQDSQDELAELVPGARHVIAARSGHYIQLDQPEPGDPRDPPGGPGCARRPLISGTGA